MRTMPGKHSLSLHWAVLYLFIITLLVSMLAAPAPVKASTPALADLPVEEIYYDITSNTTWSPGKVYYVTKMDAQVAAGATLTIQAGTIVKFAVPPDPNLYQDFLTSLTVNGNLVLLGTEASPVYFVSGRNDDFGGDTNGDGTQTQPGLADWNGLVIENRSAALTYLVVQNARYGLQVKSSLTETIAPTIQFNTFSNNHCGLTLTIQGTYNIESVVESNRFASNKFGFCTTSVSKKTGASNATLRNNIFDTNLILPIFLNGTAYPTYSGNTFIGYAGPSGGEARERHLGIGIGGTFYGTGTFQKVPGFEGKTMPYVVIENFIIPKNTYVEFLYGTTVKFFTKYDVPQVTPPAPGTSITVQGTLFLTTTPDGPITFTSYRDDDPAAGGDTNGDGADTTPYAGDWKQVYFEDVLPTGDPELIFERLNFRYAENGLAYKLNSATTTRRPIIRYSTFHGNINGLRLTAYPDKPTSILDPTIEGCAFTFNGIIPKDKNQMEPGVPILLENTVRPAYISNTFENNLHPAIGVMGTWRSSATWEAVSGQGMNQLPYLVHGLVKIGYVTGTSGQDDTVTLTIPAGTVVKFNVNIFNRNSQASLQTAGLLSLLSNPDTAPIVFTSYYDNNYGGHTSGDNTPPTRLDWLGVYVRHPLSNFDNTVFRWGEEALHIQHLGTYTLNPSITNSLFEENTNGLYLNIQNDGDITSLVENNFFNRNSYGLTTFAKSTPTAANKTEGMSKPTLRSNRFEEHSEFPIFLNGSASPVYAMDGVGNPTNSFDRNIHRAIALGGYFGSPHAVYELPQVKGDLTGVFNGKTFPYVILKDVYFDWVTSTRVAGGLVFKFDKNMEMRFLGRFEMLTTSQNKNYFTAYGDDYYDDTNGSPTPNPPPTMGVWDGVYLGSPQTPGFSYSTVKYATVGLLILQHLDNGADLSPTIAYNNFHENKRGLTLWVDNPYNITPMVNNNSFYKNEIGLHTFTNEASKSVPSGTMNPTLRANQFLEQTQFPIYLQGSSDPTYEGNIFADNKYKAIALGGYWYQDATWTSVPGDEEVETQNNIFPYVVRDTLTQAYGYYLEPPVINIPANTILKFDSDKRIYAFGLLNFMSNPNEKIILTSFRDDAYAGDTNANGNTGLPGKDSWESIWLIDFPGKTNDIHDVVAKYASTPFSVYYDGPVNTEPITKIRDSEFSNSIGGVILVIGWRKDSDGTIHGGEGNIKAELKNLVISDCDYGLLTTVHNMTTGIIKPTLENIEFRNILRYPLFLGGTSYPTFVGASYVNNTSPDLTVSAAPGDEAAPFENADLELSGFDLPGNDAVLDQVQPGEETQPMDELEASAAPSGMLVVNGVPDLSPAIGLAGAWNNSGTLPLGVDVPYAITGNFPITITISGYTSSSYKPADSVTVGDTNPPGSVARVTVPAGTIFKFGRKSSTVLFGMTVKGGLNMLSTASKPIIFTSINDDTAGGDTNGNSGATVGAKGDWDEIQLNSSYTEFQYAIVRYATDGLHLYFDGGANQNIITKVHDSTFTDNINGLTLTAKTAGDISSTVTRNRFMANTLHIRGNASDATYKGRLCVEAHENDLLGTATTQNGVENFNTNTQPVTEFPDCAFDATYNYWGDGSGPFNQNLNGAGKGSRVSSRVLFNPWKQAAVFPPPSYTITGRVTLNSAGGKGVPGVRVTLAPGQVTATTDQDGYFRFSNLASATYTLYASMSGYQFDPPQYALPNLKSDSVANFVATPTTASVKVSINSVKVFRPRGGVRVYARFTVSIDKLPDAGTSVVVKFRTVNGSATSGTLANGGDYVARSGSVMFVGGAGKPTTKTIDVEILPAAGMIPVEYFTIELYEPIGATIVQPLGTCNILPSRVFFLPMVRRK